MIGTNVRLYPDILLRAYKAGHQIGIHTWSHRALTSLDTEVVIAELEWTAMAIQEVIGVRPKYFRPPFGDIDDRVRAIASQMKLIPVIWNFDSRDFTLNINPNAIPEGQIEASVKSTASRWQSAGSGIISLQHDYTLAQVRHGPGSIKEIINSGMKPMPVAQCLGDSYPYVGAQSFPPQPTTTRTRSIRTVTMTASVVPELFPTQVPPPVDSTKNSAVISSKFGLFALLYYYI